MSGERERGGRERGERGGEGERGEGRERGKITAKTNITLCIECIHNITINYTIIICRHLFVCVKNLLRKSHTSLGNIY